jgi:hypothetical protein
MDIDTKDFNRYLCLNINFANIQEPKAIMDAVKTFANKNPDNINIIFNLNNKQLRQLSRLVETIAEHFSKNEIKINIKNTQLHHAPYILGRAGIHTFSPEEWQTYKKEIRGKTLGLACSSSGVVVDVNRFFKNFHTNKDFRDFITKTAKALLTANALQRRNSNDYFKIVNKLNEPHQHQFFRFNQNYIRFWNYDWQQQENILELMQSCKELVEDFYVSQETIFKSCGIPIRFKIVFSSATKRYDEDFLSERAYHKTTVRKPEDLYSKEMRAFLRIREKLFRIFEGGDRIRFFRDDNFQPEDLLHEFSFILNSFEIPFFCYDFKKRKGETKLTHYL